MRRQHRRCNYASTVYAAANACATNAFSAWLRTCNSESGCIRCKTMPRAIANRSANVPGFCGPVPAALQMVTASSYDGLRNALAVRLMPTAYIHFIAALVLQAYKQGPQVFGAHSGGKAMLHYAVVFLVIALIAAVFGFGGIAAGAAGIAKILFIVFLILAVGSFIFGRTRR